MRLVGDGDLQRPLWRVTPSKAHAKIESAGVRSALRRIGIDPPQPGVATY